MDKSREWSGEEEVERVVRGFFCFNVVLFSLPFPPVYSFSTSPLSLCRNRISIYIPFQSSFLPFFDFNFPTFHILYRFTL